MVHSGSSARASTSPTRPSPNGAELKQKLKNKKGTSPAVKSGSEIKKHKNFREKEELQVVLNVYDLVWDKDSKGGKNAGLVDLGLGFFHTGLELWGKEISFGHSKRYKSGVFAVKPKLAQDYMPNTRYHKTIPIATVHISRRCVDKILNRLAAKFTSESYDVLRCNCNHFTDELCHSICGQGIPEWINRPARMGSSALDALRAPFAAVGSLMNALGGGGGGGGGAARRRESIEGQVARLAAIPDNALPISPLPPSAAAASSASSSAGAVSVSSAESMRSWMEEGLHTTSVSSGLESSRPEKQEKKEATHALASFYKANPPSQDPPAGPTAPTSSGSSVTGADTPVLACSLPQAPPQPLLASSLPPPPSSSSSSSSFTKTSSSSSLNAASFTRPTTISIAELRALSALGFTQQLP